MNLNTPHGPGAALATGPIWWRPARRAVPLLLAWCLAACGGGGGDGGGSTAPGTGTGTGTGTDGGNQTPPPNTVSGNFMPAQVGDVWTYSVSSSDGGAAPDSTVRAAATRTVDGLSGTLLSTDDGDGEPRSSVLRLVGASGVDELPVDETDPLTLAVGRLRVLSQPVVLGAVVTQFDRTVANAGDIDGDGRPDSLRINATVTAVGLETVATPAGSFPGSLHQRAVATLTTTLGGSNLVVTVNLTVDDWYAPEVGLVKSVSVSRAAGVPDATSTRLLTAYRVGSRRSEAVAPTISSRGPLADTTVGAQPTLALDFSEAMDTDSLAGALGLQDSAGQPVAGTLAVTGRSLRFTPNAALASGRYTAVLGAAPQDLAGNGVAGSSATGQRWSFTVDATAPVVQSVSPADTSVNVAVGTAVQLQFSEAVDPASVTANSVLLQQDISFLVPASLSVNGNLVTITPNAPLRRGVVVQVQVNGVTDLLGNAMGASVSSFSTDPGRFGTGAVRLPGLAVTPGASAAGDLNGDGRDDAVLALAEWDGSAWRSRVQVYLQQADGSLALASQHGMPNDGDCSIASLAVGDVTGDGRADLLAGTGCGVTLLRQAADGTLAVAELLSAVSPVAFQVKLADMDGDGQLELVAFSAQDMTVRVWAGSGSTWALRGSLVASTDTASRANAFAIGDLDGDGRLDLVVSGEQLPGFSALALALQRADGSFGPVQRLSTTSNESASQLALGDVNGDGRTDIVTGMSLSMAVWLQAADGSFGNAPLRPLTAGDSVASVVLPDLNGDGRRDIVYSGFTGNVAVLLQQADGTLAAPAYYRGPSTQPDANLLLTVADFNADGRPDLLLDARPWLQRPVAAQAQSVATPVRRALRVFSATSPAPSVRAAAQAARAASTR